MKSNVEKMPSTSAPVQAVAEHETERSGRESRGELADWIAQSPRMQRQKATIQALFGPAAQRQEAPEPKPNHTGMPERLKSGVETLSGLSMDHVQVHYNSDKPAQLNALAYAQGSEIHLGPGQEKHLSHEAWHVVQQMQGRVKATTQMAGADVNDEEELEREADEMAETAQTVAQRVPVPPPNNTSIQARVIQRVEIVGVKTTVPHPAQNVVNRHIVNHKIDALNTGRYDVEYTTALNPRPGTVRRITFISDGHHAYVALRRLDRNDGPTDITALGQSAYKWSDVQYSDAIGWYETWLRKEGHVDLVRLQDIKDATESDAIWDAVDALKDWEKDAIKDSEDDGRYHDAWEAAEDNNVTDDLREALNDNGEESDDGEEADDGSVNNSMEEDQNVEQYADSNDSDMGSDG